MHLISNKIHLEIKSNSIISLSNSGAQISAINPLMFCSTCRAHFAPCLIEKCVDWVISNTWFRHVILRSPLDVTVSLNGMPSQLAWSQEVSKRKISPDMWTLFGESFKGKQIFLTYYSTWGLSEQNYVTWSKKRSNKGEIFF